MDILWLLLATLSVAALLGGLARAVRDDGLGDREPPPSHLDDAHRTPLTQVFSR
ncbi:hypothetical protein H9657_05125 [Cellulomonas sp. Sa3CUA2]|uniref:Uncharacterized protein n=1 Tax=Cellulomonas avistercoris TaxID=2762242 RepID=A0ABR8QB52_9CELL|nr:hypothetical protein [Cellulomonas avistercoris]MBD7917663.1 hypothetical protein [Cellulomonas avistercoris]